MIHASKLAEKQEADNAPHPSVDQTGRFAVDQLLRARGFRIHARPEKKEPIWTSGGVPFTQSEALKTISPQEVASAQAMEERYFGRSLGL